MRAQIPGYERNFHVQDHNPSCLEVPFNDGVQRRRRGPGVPIKGPTCLSWGVAEAEAQGGGRSKASEWRKPLSDQDVLEGNLEVQR